MNENPNVNQTSEQPTPTIVINNTQQTAAPVYTVKTTTYNKWMFLVLNFLFGGFGVDRFMRGQIGLGLLKILTIDCLGIWYLVDFIIALVKVCSIPEDDIVFVNGKYAN